MKRWHKKHRYKHGVSIRTIRKKAIELGQNNPSSNSNHNKKRRREKATDYIFYRYYMPKFLEGMSEGLKKLREEREKNHA